MSPKEKGVCVLATAVAVFRYIFVMLVLPAMAGTCKEKTGSIRSKMYTFQTIVETYAVDWGGVYAPSLPALKFEATQPRP